MAECVGYARLFAFIFGLFGLLFIVIATPTHHWFTFQSKANFLTYGGIWENCKQYANGVYSCLPLPTTDWLNCVKAFLIISIILYLMVVLYLIVLVWGRGLAIRFIGIDLLLAAMFALIAMSVYTAKYKMQPGYNYGWSYTLGWLGTVFTAISGICCFFADVDYEPM